MKRSAPISLRRLRALVRKEAYQITRDPSSILVAFVIPLLLLFIFGYGISLDADNIRIGLVAPSPGSAASDFASALEASPYFTVETGTDIREFDRELQHGKLRGIVVLPADFEKRIHETATPAMIQVVTDGSEPQIAAYVGNYTRGTFQVWSRQQAYREGDSLREPIAIEQRFRFNDAVESRHFLVPGSIAVIMTVVGALLTALVVAREWERGTMEALLASPVSRAELIIGKIIPYFVLGMLSFLLCVLAALFLFQVPLVGSLFALSAVTSLFLLTALGMGLGISAVAKDQFVAAQIALNVAFLPAFILSGFVFEIRSMPPVIQGITHIIPARYFVSALKTLFLAGDIWSILLPQMGFLLLTSILFLGITAKNMTRTLD